MSSICQRSVSKSIYNQIRGVHFDSKQPNQKIATMKSSTKRTLVRRMTSKHNLSISSKVRKIYSSSLTKYQDNLIEILSKKPSNVTHDDKIECIKYWTTLKSYPSTFTNIYSSLPNIKDVLHTFDMANYKLTVMKKHDTINSANNYYILMRGVIATYRYINHKTQTYTAEEYYMHLFNKYVEFSTDMDLYNSSRNIETLKAVITKNASVYPVDDFDDITQMNNIISEHREKYKLKHFDDDVSHESGFRLNRKERDNDCYDSNDSRDNDEDNYTNFYNTLLSSDQKNDVTLFTLDNDDYRLIRDDTLFPNDLSKNNLVISATDCVVLEVNKDNYDENFRIIEKLISDKEMEKLYASFLFKNLPKFIFSKSVAPYWERWSYVKHQELFEYKEKVNHVYILIKGEVEVYVNTTNWDYLIEWCGGILKIKDVFKYTQSSCKMKYFNPNDKNLPVRKYLIFNSTQGMFGDYNYFYNLKTWFNCRVISNNAILFRIKIEDFKDIIEPYNKLKYQWEIDSQQKWKGIFDRLVSLSKNFQTGFTSKSMTISKQTSKRNININTNPNTKRNNKGRNSQESNAETNDDQSTNTQTKSPNTNKFPIASSVQTNTNYNIINQSNNKFTSKTLINLDKFPYIPNHTNVNYCKGWEDLITEDNNLIKRSWDIIDASDKGKIKPSKILQTKDRSIKFIKRKFRNVFMDNFNKSSKWCIKFLARNRPILNECTGTETNKSSYNLSTWSQQHDKLISMVSYKKPKNIIQNVHWINKLNRNSALLHSSNAEKKTCLNQYEKNI